MDRHRSDRPGGDRGGEDMSRRMRSSRWAGDSPPDDHHRFPRGRGSGGGFGGGGGGGRFHPYRGPQDYPTGGGGGGGPGFRGGPDGGGFGHGGPIGGPKRGLSGRGGGSPEYADGDKLVKLFIGSVPRTATEEDIRPLFEEHGNVIEVAMIRDKRSGQQQGFCFVKYATMEEADRAIAALHHQYTLPGAVAPLQVRHADGDRDRYEDKLFVASLNKRASEQEIAEVFSPYGHVEDVYLMRDELRQSRGCGFVRFSSREMAAAAMNALNGTYVMRGCDQPLIVRFADPKRPRPEPRGGPAFGGPGFGRPEGATGFGPPGKFDESIGSRMPPNAWRPGSPQSRGPSSQNNIQGFGPNPSLRGGTMDTSSTITGASGETGGLTGGAQLNYAATSSQQGFNPSIAQIHPVIGQQMISLQKPFMPPQNLPPAMQQVHNQQISGPYSQAQALLVQGQQVGQLQVPQSAGLPSNQNLPSQQLTGFGGQLSASQPPIQQNPSANALQPSISIPQQGMVSVGNHQQLPSTISQQMLQQQPMQQMPSQIPPGLLQQQAQSLQSSVQSSRQAIFQLQQQLQVIQQQHVSQNAKQQNQWSGPQQISTMSASTPAIAMPSAGSLSSSAPLSAAPVVPLTCNWTEHTSPEGFKYYYNSVTQESKWEKPEEYSTFEQQQQQQKLLLFQQQQQKLAVQQLQPTAQTQPQTQIQPNQSIPQAQQLQAQMQLRQQQAQIQFLQPSLSYPASGLGNHQSIQNFNYAQMQSANAVTDTARAQQGIQAAPELTWQNRSTGS